MSAERGGGEDVIEFEEGELPIFNRGVNQMAQRGGLILVTGEVRQRIRSAASQRLFGSGEDTRRVLLGVGDPGETRSELPPGAATDPDHYAEILLSASRSATNDDSAHQSALTERDDEQSPLNASSSLADGADVRSVTNVRSDDLDAIQTTIHREVYRLYHRAGIVQGGQIRLGVGSMSALLGIHDTEALRTLIGMLGMSIRGVRGIGHIILPLPRSHDLVQDALGEADALVELRPSSGEAGWEWRWEMVDSKASPGWRQPPETESH